MLWHAISPVSDTGRRSRSLVGSRRMNSDAKIIVLYVEGLPDEERLGLLGPLSDYARAAGIDSGPYKRAKRFLKREGYLHQWSYPFEGGRWATAQILANAPITPQEAKAVWARREHETVWSDEGPGEGPGEGSGEGPGGGSGNGSHRGPGRRSSWGLAGGWAPLESALPQVNPSDVGPPAGRLRGRRDGGYPPDGQLMARSSHLPTRVVENSNAERVGSASRFELGPLLADESDSGFWADPPEWLIEQDPVGVTAAPVARAEVPPPRTAPVIAAAPVDAPAAAYVRAPEAGRVREPWTEPVRVCGPTAAPAASAPAPEPVHEPVPAPVAASVLEPESVPVPERVPVAVPVAAPAAVAEDPGEARGKGWTPEMVLAEQVLLSLRKETKQLHLGQYEVRGLVDKAAEWLRRGVSAADMRYVLSSQLPKDGVRSAVGFVRHRLTEKMPPEPGHRRVVAGAVARGASRPQGVDRPGDVVFVPGRGWVSESGEDLDREVVPEVPLVVCEGPGDEHMLRAYGGRTKCEECQQAEAFALWAARRDANARARGEDGLTGDGTGGWRDRLAGLAPPGGAGARPPERPADE
ncbi:hypothetical protein [Streptomyces sp. NPDC060198]|uniref:hypothetical protein n=1 Tax=Streptomyces sp. NPDC060198 TaxID=3347070 RepID=UPI00364D2D4E